MSYPDIGAVVNLYSLFATLFKSQICQIFTSLTLQVLDATFDDVAVLARWRSPPRLGLFVALFKSAVDPLHLSLFSLSLSLQLALSMG